MFNRNRRHSRGCRGNNPHCCPPQMMPTQFDPAQFDPTQQFVRTNIMHTVVPHVHPSHITTVNKHIIDHQHHFPVTESVVNECCEKNTMCGTPYNHHCGPQPRR